MKYRISVIECSNIDEKWIIYIPEYKHWYNLFWQRWSDSFSGRIDHYRSYEEVKKFIHNQKVQDSFTTKRINIYNQ